MQLGDLEGKSIWCGVLGSFSARSLLISFFKSSTANIKEGIATRACGANGFSVGMVFGLVFCKGGRGVKEPFMLLIEGNVWIQSLKSFDCPAEGFVLFVLMYDVFGCTMWE